MTSAEISIIPEFQEKISRLNIEDSFKVNAKDIYNLRTGSDILFRGIKVSSGVQTANLKSINGLSCFVVDEAEEFIEEDIFNTIDFSIRIKDIQNRVIMILNPTNKNHWIYKRWIQNTSRLQYFDGIPVEISTHPDVLHIHSTYLDNLDNLNLDFIEKLKKIKIEYPKIYAHKIIGQWAEAVEGALFEKAALNYYKPSDMMEKGYESSIAYIDIADQGDDYLSMAIGKNIKEKIYITDVVFSDANADVTISQCAEALKRNKVAYCRVESNSMGAMFGRNLQKLVPECQILGANSTTNKITRITMDAPFISNYFVFKHESERSAMYDAFINNLCSFTKDGKAAHDDAADNVSGLAIFVRGMLPDLY